MSSKTPLETSPFSNHAVYEQGPLPDLQVDDQDDKPIRSSKRPRKPINCAPCRASKLKCDRNRPCSSCVLRSTTSGCYVDGSGFRDSSDQIDAGHEIEVIRKASARLETLFAQNQRAQSVQDYTQPPDLQFPFSDARLKLESSNLATSADDMTGTKTSALARDGMYTGPTTVAGSHLITKKGETSSRCSSRGSSVLDAFSAEYDRDLLAELPPFETMDGLIRFYFEYCNWIYRHVNEAAFLNGYSRYKAGENPDRIILCTACVIIAVAVHYLPSNHALQTGEDLGQQYYNIMFIALQRHLVVKREYTLDLVELYLIRCHFQTLSKKDPEEIWAVAGELVSIGIAMGLHQDPMRLGRWRNRVDVAERRRTAWWHILLLERWQAFMFGRPLRISSLSFDTHLPTQCGSSSDPNGRLYLPNIALFQLAFILGSIMDDATSTRPVQYDSVLRQDRALTEWEASLPRELVLNDYGIASSLASDDCNVRRLAVQSVIIRTVYHHIRFTLHRLYANTKANISPSRLKQSLDIAVGSADRLIALVATAQPSFLANVFLAVPGHLNWAPFHCFSAAMFFSFQLIADPDQACATLYRNSINKALSTLEKSSGMPVADIAVSVLQALAPLYAPEFKNDTLADREQKKNRVYSVVMQLPFPYHDGPKYPRGIPTSPTVRSPSTPKTHASNQAMSVNPYTPPHDGSSSTPASLSPPSYSASYSAPNGQLLQPSDLQRYRDSSQHYSTNPESHNQPHLYSPHQSHNPRAHGQPLHSHSNSSSSAAPYEYTPLRGLQSVGTQTYEHQTAQNCDAVMGWGASVGMQESEWSTLISVLGPQANSNHSAQHRELI